MKWLAGDLQYTGIASDVDILDQFIYDDLGKRLERKTTHVRRSPFTEPQVRNTNATKKGVRKVVQKHQLNELFIFAQSVERLAIQRLIVLELRVLKKLTMYMI